MNMNKPQPKKEIKIEFVLSSYISFFATPDAASEMEKFGKVTIYRTNHYGLQVDGRFDFQEVVDYINRYGGA